MKTGCGARRNAWRGIGWMALASIVVAGCGSKPTMTTVLRNFQQKNYPKVVEECRVLLQQNPQDVQAYRFLIRASKQLGTLDELRQEYAQRVTQDPSDAVMRFALGYAFVQQREFVQALQELERALELDPQVEYVNYVIGWVHFNPLAEQYDVDRGVEAWNREVALNPSSLGALQVYRDLGSYYEERGEFERAREQMRAFRQYAFSEGDRIAARDLLERLKQNELDVVQLQQRANAEDADAETLIEYATKLYRWQRQEDAIPYWERAIALRPESPELHNFLGMAHMELQHNSAAIAEFERAVALQPEYAEPHHNLGMLHDTLGDQVAALRHFERYLELQPFSQQAEVLRLRVDELRAALGSAPTPAG